MNNSIPTPIIIMTVVFVIFIVIIFAVVIPVLKKKDKQLYEKMKNRENNTLDESEFLQNLKEAVNKTINPNSNKKYCEYCGSEIEEGATKCAGCGAKSKKK